MRFPLGRRKEGHRIQVRILPGIVWLFPRETQDFASLLAAALIVISRKHIQLFAVNIKYRRKILRLTSKKLSNDRNIPPQFIAHPCLGDAIFCVTALVCDGLHRGKQGNFMTQQRGKGMKADQPAYVHHQRTDDLLG